MLYTTSTENAAICEVLGGQITDGKTRQHDLRTALGDVLKLLVDNVPLGVDDLLEVLGVAKSDLSIFLLAL